jgi:hypoxanthine phosphoribosyltransferase
LLHDKNFTALIAAEEIQQRVSALAAQLNTDYANKKVLFIAILNGSFMFAADLLKNIQMEARISFVKVSSYNGTASSGQLKTILGLEESVFGQSVIIVEDIVDTGLTLGKIVDDLKSLGAQSVETVSLLRKKPARDKAVEVEYVGFELDHEFVVGYGLDYDGLGRNLPSLYHTTA